MSTDTDSEGDDAFNQWLFGDGDSPVTQNTSSVIEQFRYRLTPADGCICMDNEEQDDITIILD